jgi:hypothetical protein
MYRVKFRDYGITMVAVVNPTLYVVSDWAHDHVQRSGFPSCTFNLRVLREQAVFFLALTRLTSVLELDLSCYFDFI